jgi:hypothetical protein
VRKLDHNNVEPELVPHISSFRDNVAHIVTHTIHQQKQHWGKFMTQQGSGDFDLDADDDDDDDDDDDGTTASDEVPLAARPRAVPLAAGTAAPAADTRHVSRYALGRTVQSQSTLLGHEKTIHDEELRRRRGWSFNDVTLAPGAGPSGN